MQPETKIQKIEKEMFNRIRSYFSNILEIDNDDLTRLVLKAYLDDDKDVLDSILERENLENLNIGMTALLKARQQKIYYARDQASISHEAHEINQKGEASVCLYEKTDTRVMNSVSSVNNTDNNIDNIDNTDNNNAVNFTDEKKHIINKSDSESDTSSFALEVLPDHLIPIFKDKEKPVGLNAFIYKMETNASEDKEETVNDKIDEIRKALSENNVVIVQGNTGCGKTTKIPAMLLANYKKIVCTQPRRIAAINTARRVAQELNSQLGHLVGYAVRFDDKTSASTRLSFVTDGILLRELASSNSKSYIKYQNPIKHKKTPKNDNKNGNTPIKEDTPNSPIDSTCGDRLKSTDSVIKNKDEKFTDGSEEKISNRIPSSKNITEKCAYDLVIIDEAHERTLNIDFLMGYFKTQKNVKFLIMSATLDTEKFMDYFNCPCISIKHKVYPIKSYYLKRKTDNFLESALQTVLGILNKYDSGDILVFLTGHEEIERGAKELTERISGFKVDILRLYSQIPPEEQDKIFIPGPRKVILSTNIAETSITIQTVKFVVDCGNVRQMRQSCGSSVNFLEVVKISKAQAKQRMGRAGRIGPGIVFKLYTHEEYLAMDENPIPEILRSSLHSTILSLKSLNIEDVMNFDYIERPPPEAIRHSMSYLYYLKAIDDRGRITALGGKLASMPLDPEMSMAILTAKKLNVLDEVSTIVAFLNAGPIFPTSPELSKLVKNAKSAFYHKKGEFYTFLVIYDAWKTAKFSNAFLTKYFLKTRVMIQIVKVKFQLMNRQTAGTWHKLKEMAMNLTPNNKSIPVDGSIERSFCSGYFMNVSKISLDNHVYTNLFGGFECFIHPGDPLFKTHPKYVLFHEIICFKKEYMRNCLEVDSKILLEACNSTKHKA